MSNESPQLIKPDALTPAEVEEKTEQIGLAKAHQSSSKSFVLAIMAGLFIGMGGMFMLLVRADASFSFATSQVFGGFVFCLGLFLVVAAGAELFTGNTLMVCGALSKRFGWSKVFKNWGVVYLGNLVGALFMAAILFFVDYGAMNSGGVGNAMITVATAKVAQPFEVLFAKGILCNFLVCLAVWISYSCRSVVDKFVAILFPITAFVACGFEHCIANMFFLPMGLLMVASGFDYTGAMDVSLLTMDGAIVHLVAVTLGNIVGGAVLVGIVYWFVYSKKQSA